MQKTLIGMFAAVVCSVAFATEYYVAPGGTGDYLTAATAGGDPNYCARALAKTSGDVIHLAAGTYTLGGTTAYTGQQIFLQQGVKVIGATDNPADTVIDGNGQYRAFCCNPQAQVRNLTMRNCTTVSGTSGNGYGGAVCAQNDARPGYVISNCVVEGCSATYRGGGGSHGIWYDCVIRNCTVTKQGYRDANDLRDEGSGGGIWAGTLYRCVVTNNTAGFMGGGVAGGRKIGDGTSGTSGIDDRCVAYDCIIGWNTAAIGGGAGVRNGDPRMQSQCQLVRCTLVGNRTQDISGYTSNRGGGADGCQLTDCDVRGNQSKYDGGGIRRSIAEGCTIEGNSVSGSGTYYGGGAADSALTNCVVRGNTAPNGGGAYSSELVGCTISNNIATVANGGGLYGGSSYNCIVAFNVATNNTGTTAARGGAIFQGYHQGDLVYSNLYVNGAAVSTFANDSDRKITIVNCTVVNNLTYKNSSVNGFNIGYATNCIIYGHANTDVYNCQALVNCAWKEDMMTHSQTDAKLAGAVNCINNRTLGAPFDPKFVTNPGEGECPFSLAIDSPCRDAGLNLPWMTNARDILGNRRIFRGTKTVDIGALECTWKLGLVISVQ